MEKYMETGVIASYLEPQKSKAPGRIVLTINPKPLHLKP